MIRDTMRLFNITDVNKHDEGKIYYREKGTRCLGKRVEVGHYFDFEKHEYWTIKPDSKIIPENEVFTAKDAAALFEGNAKKELNEVIQQIKKSAKTTRYLHLAKLSKFVNRELISRGFKIERIISPTMYDSTYKITW